jgi:hypothetical protein
MYSIISLKTASVMESYMGENEEIDHKSLNLLEKCMFHFKYFFPTILDRFWPKTAGVRPPIFPDQQLFLGPVLSF